MTNISLKRALTIICELEDKDIKLNEKDIYRLEVLKEIYSRCMEWELLWVKKYNDDYVSIQSVEIVLKRYYPLIRKLRSKDFFMLNYYTKLWFLEWGNKNNSRYFKPTQLLIEYIK